MKTTRVVFALLFLFLFVSRLAHVGILWTEEDLPLAAAVQMLHGKVLYRDVFFDKPPLTAAVCLLWGARIGWVLRLAGALYLWLACLLIYCFARDMWGRREGLLAACGLAFFLTFAIPAAVIPLAADMLMLVPHLAAVYLASRGRAFWSGVVAGVALLFHSKGFFVLAACALWLPRSLPALALGFLVPNLACAAVLGAQGALGAFWQQVWVWGRVYAGHTFVERPVWNGLIRSANWLGFHAALAAPALWFWWRDKDSDRLRLALWAALSFAGVAAGWRFFPRYFIQVLPVMTLSAARGFTLLGARSAVALLLLAIPLARFGPRYALLAGDLLAARPHQWRDAAMDRDSREAAALVQRMARPDDTLFVWGYRPDILVYTRMPIGTRFLDSQPLTGVFADRHLFQSAPLEPDWTRANREELVRAHPTFVLDGLTAFNPTLSIRSYPDLQPWLAAYEEVARTRFTVVYRLR